MKSRESLNSTLKLYSSKVKNLEMDKLPDVSNQTKLNQEDIKHWDSSITCNEIEAVIKCLPTNKSPGPDGFLGKCHQTLKKN
jgi:hypothetical protein